MCTATISTLTLTTMLEDPLIHLVMRSDNVSAKDHSELLFRVKDSLIARAQTTPALSTPVRATSVLATSVLATPALSEAASL